MVFEAGHCEQTDAPDCDEKVPAMQGLQYEDESLPSDDTYFPASQSMQLLPALVEYLPAGHS